MSEQSDLWEQVIVLSRKSQEASILSEVTSEAAENFSHETVECFKDASKNTEAARAAYKELRKDQNCEKCPLDNLED